MTEQETCTSAPAAPSGKPVAKWEYFFQTVFGWEVAEARMQEFGEQGWELVHVRVADMGFYAVPPDTEGGRFDPQTGQTKVHIPMVRSYYKRRKQPAGSLP